MSVSHYLLSISIDKQSNFINHFSIHIKPSLAWSDVDINRNNLLFPTLEIGYGFQRCLFDMFLFTTYTWSSAIYLSNFMRPMLNMLLGLCYVVGLCIDVGGPMIHYMCVKVSLKFWWHNIHVCYLIFYLMNIFTIWLCQHYVTMPTHAYPNMYKP